MAPKKATPAPKKATPAPLTDAPATASATKAPVRNSVKVKAIVYRSEDEDEEEPAPEPEPEPEPVPEPETAPDAEDEAETNHDADHDADHEASDETETAEPKINKWIFATAVVKATFKDVEPELNITKDVVVDSEGTPQTNTDGTIKYKIITPANNENSSEHQKQFHAKAKGYMDKITAYMEEHGVSVVEAIRALVDIRRNANGDKNEMKRGLPEDAIDVLNHQLEQARGAPARRLERAEKKRLREEKKEAATTAKAKSKSKASSAAADMEAIPSDHVSIQLHAIVAAAQAALASLGAAPATPAATKPETKKARQTKKRPAAAAPPPVDLHSDHEDEEA
jgi:hypothetical protein